VVAIFGNVNTTKSWINCTIDSCTGSLFRDTPLIIASKNGHVEVVRVLLEGGANVDKIDDFWCTALNYAVHNGHLDVCRLLLDWGAKGDTVNWWKDTPLLWGARTGHLSVLKLLVERGADDSVHGDKDQTTSDLAHIKGYKEVAEWLDSVSRG
jgi:ankyrin repeat protein